MGELKADVRTCSLPERNQHARKVEELEHLATREWHELPFHYARLDLGPLIDKAFAQQHKPQSQSQSQSQQQSNHSSAPTPNRTTSLTTVSTVSSAQSQVSFDSSYFAPTYHPIFETGDDYFVLEFTLNLPFIRIFAQSPCITY